MTKKQVVNCVQTDIDRCKIKNWKKKNPQNKADWLNSINEAGL